MRKTIFNALIIVCSLILTILILDCTIKNKAFGAENEAFQIPKKYLSQTPEWEKCELVEGKKGLREAECVDITVPLYWNDPEGETIKIHVKRFKALLNATKQMWLLAGGPGEAGTAILPLFIKKIAQLDWRTDFYTLDHRGTGNSNRLGCPDQEADGSDEGIWLTESEGAACIDYLETNYNNLDAFTVTQAAKDVVFLVELLKVDNKEIFVYGRSYGTYWAHRYAQIAPLDQADGIILDSVLPPVVEMDQTDINANYVAKDLFDICKEDKFCRMKMGDDPWEKADGILTKFKDGHCPEVVENGFTREHLQLYGARALDYWDLRILLPAFYYRIGRCSEQDVRAFKWFSNIFLSLMPSPNTRSFSDVLRQHIGLSELIGDNPMPPEVMKEIDATLVATEHLATTGLALLDKGWPTYPTDEYYKQWVSPDVPILMLNGTLDRLTTIDMASRARDNLTGPHQYFVEFPNVCHVVTESSPVTNIFAPHCGMQIMLDYMEDPLTHPDTSCIDDLAPINFRGNPWMALQVFGTLDIWGK